MSAGTFTLLGAQALLPIVVGSFQSLRTPAPVRARRKAARRAARRDALLGADEDEEDDEDDAAEETLTLADSMLFPILGSVALITLWLLIKYVDKMWIDLALGAYFTFAGIFAVQSTISSVLDYTFRLFGCSGPVYHIRISAGIKQIFHLPCRRSAFIALPFALALPLAYIPLGKPYMLNNALGLCLAAAALALLKLDGFPTAFLLLALLLVYDIFWVFYTPVMVTVAKGIDAPIKLLAPKPGTSSYSMLGLGDIVVPGLMIALCLRFDLCRHALRNPTKDVSPRSPFGKPYFFTCVTAYVGGLATTVYAMQLSGKAQPALLYLSPACIVAPALVGVARGEIKLLWTWRDEEEEVADESIEKGSEVAMKARAEAKARAAAEEKDKDAKADSADFTPEATETNGDESWMETATAEPKKKRRGGKRK